MARRSWTNEEDSFIKENYKNMRVYEMAEKLNRTYDSTSDRMGKLGLITKNKKRKFTTEEDEFLVENYTLLGAKKCGEILGATEHVTARHARVHLKLKTFSWAVWKEEDDVILLRDYESNGCEFCANILGRPMSAVYKRAESLGLRVAPKERKPHISGGYIMIPIGTGSFIAEHRYVMEQFLGRKLTSDEIVHHIDGDKFNNDISNLVLTNRAAHMKHHHDDISKCQKKRKSKSTEDIV